jgi:hypothetical protein
VDGVDQRGEPRNVDGRGDGNPANQECDIGAFEAPPPPPPGATIDKTADGPGTTSNGVRFGEGDILRWDGTAWSKLFDATDAGLTNGHDIDAIHVNEAGAGSADLYFSLARARMTAGVGRVATHDVLRFNGLVNGGFSFFFDGSDVGLTTTAENVDGLHILPGSLSPIGGDTCQAYLLISTRRAGQVPATGGGTLRFRGEDILGFCATSTGATTTGLWHLRLDGSAEGMPANSTVSLSANDDGTILYITTKGNFNVDSASGRHSHVYKFEGGSFSGPVFSAPANGLNKKVDSLHVEGDL